MNDLPDELCTSILDYLEPHDIVSSQRVSSRLLKVARDSALWRYKCFEKAPSAAHSQANRPNALEALTGALDGLSLGQPARPPANAVVGTGHARASKRAKAVAEWDCSDPSEHIDWYSEYIGRHAELFTEWSDFGRLNQELRGMALLNQGEKVVAPTEDGSLFVFNIEYTANGRRLLKRTGRSRRNLLLQDHSGKSEPSMNARSMGTAIDNISIDSVQKRAYASAEDQLTEVDLETMQVISQHKYAWPITAVSAEVPDLPFNLTIGTSWSLQIHDPRFPLGSPSLSPASDPSARISTEEDSIAFLPNYTKLAAMQCASVSASTASTESPSDLDSFFDAVPRSGLRAYARVDPGPQSVLHRPLAPHEIVIAGRMPSILFYDRRFFPRLQSVIHSGARLSSLAWLDVPPCSSSAEHTTAAETLIAAGEYKGCGSLEIYQLPYTTSSPSSTSAAAPYQFRNRQSSSATKLLSVATQGTRIVFSDAEGTMKWVERDGKGLARRWNINSYTLTATGAGISGEQVVRKMIPLPEPDTARGTRGDGDLLVWTGERIGIVGTKVRWSGHDELVEAFERGMTLRSSTAEDDGKVGGRSGSETESEAEFDARKREEEYARQMRRALERQADERRWMSRFGGRRW